MDWDKNLQSYVFHSTIVNIQTYSGVVHFKEKIV